jgi:hypothetical protein
MTGRRWWKGGGQFRAWAEFLYGEEPAAAEVAPLVARKA